MNLREYFEQPLTGTLDKIGEESVWLDLALLSITSGRLAFGDPCYFPGLQVELEVVAGNYQVQAKVRDFGTGRRISALCALAVHGAVHKLVEVKNFAVDTGTAAICDYQRFKTALAVIKQANADFRFINSFSDQFGIVRLGEPPVEMAYVQSGWGDDIYTVDAYVNLQGKTIGGEVLFIENDLDIMEDVEPFQIATYTELEEKANNRQHEDKYMDSDRLKQMKSGMSEMFNGAAQTYDQVGPRFFQPLGKRLVEVAEIPVGAKVLDVAAGRGAVLFPAAERVGAQGHVVGIDLAEAMVSETNAEIQRRGLTNAEMRVMDAEELDFADEAFDVVLCGFGLFFFPQCAKACTEMRRVLKTSGTLGLTTWGRDDERWLWMREVQQKYRPPSTSSSSPAPNPFNNAAGIEDILTKAHFEQIRVIGEDPEFVYADEETWWATQWSHVGRGFLESLSPEALAQYKAEAFAQLHLHNKQTHGFHQMFATLFTLAVKGASVEE